MHHLRLLNITFDPAPQVHSTSPNPNWNVSFSNTTLQSCPDDDTYPHHAELRTSTGLERFSASYQLAHGYVSLVVCVFGIVSNVMNIVVLTRRNMITATNYILTALAVADMLTMISYMPYAVYFYCVAALDEGYPHPWGWIVYLIFNTNFNITCHTAAMWLTVSLAVFRYIVVCHHNLGPRLCNLHRAKVAIAVVLLTTVVFCVPNYVMHTTYSTGNGTYWLHENYFVTATYKSVYYWSFGVVLKVAPCALLAVLSALLICAMKAAAKKRRHLKAQGKKVESERANEHYRTTAMLVSVVMCFVATELPQGVLAFLSGVDRDIFENVYVPLGDVWDILVLVNSAVNFILYCVMNRRFRSTFCHVFCAYAKAQRVNSSLLGQPSSFADTQFSRL